MLNDQVQAEADRMSGAQTSYGATLALVEDLLGAELAIAAAYFAAGALLLRVFEQQARTSGSFERF
jgi:hypothetical protein